MPVCEAGQGTEKSGRKRFLERNCKACLQAFQSPAVLDEPVSYEQNELWLGECRAVLVARQHLPPPVTWHPTAPSSSRLQSSFFPSFLSWPAVFFPFHCFLIHKVNEQPRVQVQGWQVTQELPTEGAGPGPKGIPTMGPGEF